MKQIEEAEILQSAAVIVAAPRYVGAFAYALGIVLPTQWLWFANVEIMSGAAMAILEGWAIAYISRHWRRAQGKPRRTLLVMQIILMVLLPATATPYLFGAEVGMKSMAVMPIALVWLWKFTVAAIAPLVVLAVGYASGQKPAKSASPAKLSADKPAKPASEPAKSASPAKLSADKPAKPASEPARPRYTCEVCGQGFASQPALNAHGRAHR